MEVEAPQRGYTNGIDRMQRAVAYSLINLWPPSYLAEECDEQQHSLTAFVHQSLIPEGPLLMTPSRTPVGHTGENVPRLRNRMFLLI
jgi:hypothetical protein